MAGFGKHWHLATGLDGKSVNSLVHLADVVVNVDDFLSHCWRDPWWQKVFGLMVTYNLVPAVVMGNVGAMCMYVLQREGYLPTMTSAPFLGVFGGHAPPYSPWCFSVGTLIMIVCLAWWQNMLAFMRLVTGVSLDRRAFFDRICVDQSNEEDKQKAIRDIGGYVAKSNRMVVFWSKVYLTRLWCTFEMACRLHAQDLGHLRCLEIFFLPLPLAVICFVGFVLAVTTLIEAAFVMEYIPAGPQAHGVSDLNLSWVCHPPLLRFCLIQAFANAFSITLGLVIGLPFIRSYLRDRQCLTEQLAHFDVRNVDCFSQADRKQVYATIGQWFNLVSEAKCGLVDKVDPGLDAFNSYIRGRFMEHVLANIGPPHVIPYRLALLIAAPVAFAEMDYSVAIFHMGNFKFSDEAGSVLAIWVSMLCTLPIFISMVLRISMRVAEPYDNICNELLGTLTVALLLGGLYFLLFASSMMALLGGLFLSLANAIVQGALTWQIYGPLRL
eukprot:gnl/MRDRNA2_/MRDRNA2_66781_c0_seq1.p1 gnl/MRDRNA2_/MRDRNA2_66781_c0~~gnl/MRDRNA2_/MRDRNA2_66781_c0_seq1.p1  ORF type:complete len:514 (-),score=73.93 gnl/MRDRNA2_/MRDRNA2_66781_c0_seq1:156-1640(-)